MENRCSADQIPGDDIIPNEKPNAQGSPGNHPPLPPNGNMIKIRHVLCSIISMLSISWC